MAEGAVQAFAPGDGAAAAEEWEARVNDEQGESALIKRLGQRVDKAEADLSQLRNEINEAFHKHGLVAGPVAIDRLVKQKQKAEAAGAELRAKAHHVFNSARTNDRTEAGNYIVDSDLLLDLEQTALSSDCGEDFQGVGLIAAERKRQVVKERWTATHDDEHKEGELRTAAECYVYELRIRNAVVPRHNSPPPAWPYDNEDWKPTEDPVRQLVKAGALIAAEIDRLLRRGGERKP